MGATAYLKTVTDGTLTILLAEPPLVDLFITLNPGYRAVQRDIDLFADRYPALRPLLAERVVRLKAEWAEPCLELDKSWFGLRMMLTGDPKGAGGNEPLSMAVHGGTPFGPEFDYGRATYLSVQQVQDVAAALSRADATAMSAVLQARGAIWPDEDVPIWAERFDELTEYYARAARDARGMISFLI
jgi:hypothetical protein